MGVVKSRAAVLCFNSPSHMSCRVCGVPRKQMLTHPRSLTWLGALIHRAIVDLVDELGTVVIHVDDVDIQINRILHLVAVHIHCMGSELQSNRHTSELAATSRGVPVSGESGSLGTHSSGIA